MCWRINQIPADPQQRFRALWRMPPGFAQDLRRQAIGLLFPAIRVRQRPPPSEPHRIHVGRPPSDGKDLPACQRGELEFRRCSARKLQCSSRYPRPRQSLSAAPVRGGKRQLPFMRGVRVKCITLELPVHVVSRISRSQLRRNSEHSTACFWSEFPRIRMMTSTTKR